MKKKLFLFILMTLALAGAALAMGVPPRPPAITELQKGISAELERMDKDLALAAAQLSAAGLEGEAAGRVLRNFYEGHSSVVNVAAVSLDGRLGLIEPEKYKSSEGQSIADQPHFILLKASGKPVMSGMFRAVEGFYAVSLAYPVVSPDGRTAGYVSAVFKPDALMGGLIKPFIEALPEYEALAIQKDGRIIYDRDILQVGKMTFSDPAYQAFPSLLELARAMTREASGAGSYEYFPQYGTVPVRKAAEWTTVGLHGVEWRLMLSRVVN